MKNFIQGYVVGLFIGGLLVALMNNANADSGVAFKALRATALHFDMGSGSLVRGKSGKTYMLTNWHVCTVSKQDGFMHGALPDGTSFVGRVTLESPTSDLCAIEVSSKDFLAIGHEFPFTGELYTRGYPMGVLGEFSGHYTGVKTFNLHFSIERLGECPQYFDKIRDTNGLLVGCVVEYTNYITTLFVKPGSSGSPVVDDNGSLVGVIDTHSPNEGSGLVPFYKIRKFLDLL